MKTHKVDSSTIIFNTERGYSPNGQIIVAVNRQPQGLIFYDHTLDVIGILDVHWNGTPVAAAILIRYDAGHFKSGPYYELRAEFAAVARKYVKEVI